jgi:hypothetical protein
VFDGHRDDGGAVGVQRIRERLLNLLLGPRTDRSAAEAFSRRNYVQLRKIKSGNIGRFLKFGKLLEDGVFAVARNDVDDLEFMLSS